MLDLNSTQQRVFIVGDGSLFDSAITRLVTYGADLIASHAIYSGLPTFLDLIKSDDWPDTILVNESGLLVAEHFFDLISTHIFSSEPIMLGLCIIVVRLGANVMDVYARPVFIDGKMFCKPHRISIPTGDDLLDAVTRKYYDHEKVIR